MTLEERIAFVSNHYPDTMTQLQFGEAVGLGKSSTYKLLRDGVISYEDKCEGLKHYHMIKKEEAIRYLKVKYAHASEAYREAGRRCIAVMLWDEPEILSMKDVVRITGLWKNAVQKWIRTGKLRGSPYKRKTIIRKVDLIEFMASPEYQDSSHRNIRAEAVTLAVEWYLQTIQKMRKGDRQSDI